MKFEIGEIGKNLPRYVIKWLWENACRYPNVLGWSNVWQPRIRQHRTIWDELTVKFYVKHKIYPKYLHSQNILPSILNLRHLQRKKRFETDVVDIGRPVALPRKSTVDKTVNFRPVELGVSLGNEAITAGSLGNLYAPASGINFNPAGSNAHVIADDPVNSPEQVMRKNILQRGSYHGGKVPDDVVGEYLWHKQIFTLNDIISDCDVANGVKWLLNGISWICGRKSRFRVYVDSPINTIDFGLYKPTVKHILKVADGSIDPILKPFIGHLYAGSESIGIICKISEILNEAKDYIKGPLSGKMCDVAIGDKVKMCSFWCNTTQEVTDTDATLNVGGYGGPAGMAMFTKAIMVTNEGSEIRGGYSGSGVFLVEN